MIAVTGLLSFALIWGSSSGFSVGKFIANFSVQVPEPGMMLLFGLGAGALGLRIGRKSK
jgi:PEP-CTERM motif